MGRIRDTIDDAGWLVLLVMGAKLLASWPSLSAIQAENRDRFKKGAGGRGAGPAPTFGSGAGNGKVWSESTMQLFAEEMGAVPIDPFLVLLAISCASNFNADEFLGSNTGLLLVQREDLSSLGYPAVPTFEELDAPHQIPWIARVISYRMASSNAEPKTVGELAVLLHPGNPTITDMLRTEGDRRAEEMKGNGLYLEHQILLQHVLHGSEHPTPPGWGP